MKNVVISGVGIHAFGRHDDLTYRDLGSHAAREALDDAGASFADVDFTFVANVGAGTAKGANIAQLLGASGSPVISVEAACGSSGAALQLGATLIESGAASCVLCIGVEKTPRGLVSAGFEDWQMRSGLGVIPAYFGLDAAELLATTDATVADLADVSVKNHDHAVHNPNAMYRRRVTREQVLDSKMVCDPLRLLMLCSPTDGAAAAVLMSRERAQALGVDKPINVLAVSLVSKIPTDSFVPMAARPSTGWTSFAARAAQQAYEEAGIGPGDLDLVECQDTDSASELLAYRALSLCAPGDEAGLLRSGATTFAGRLPVNVSGGLLSKGEPLGASGLGQVHEVVSQLRGEAGVRQVLGARVGMSHVFGAGHTASAVILSS
jgi:acetyl-CoA acetyltransferase